MNPEGSRRQLRLIGEVVPRLVGNDWLKSCGGNASGTENMYHWPSLKELS